MSVFDMIAPTRIDRSKFDLSHERIFSLDMGQLIPFLVKECAPNDRWQISNSMVLRMLPMLSPVLADINVYCHYFFVPSRYLLKDSEGKWSDFISGGKDGMSTVTLPEVRPSFSDAHPSYGSNGLPGSACSYSLWDYLGLPVNKTWSNGGHGPIALPFRAYIKIYNDWYRDPLLQPNEIEFGETDSFCIQFRNLHKDYFISALKQPQLGTAPTLPIEGNLFVQYLSEAQSTGLGNSVGVTSWTTDGSRAMPNYGASVNGGEASPYGTTVVEPTAVFHTLGGANSNTKPLYVDLGNSVSSNVNELRILYATQRFMERNNVAGGCVDPSRYGDFLLAHWGIRPSDVELGRSEYIGGSKNPFLVGEVAQTSQTTTTGDDASPQGNLSGSGMCAGRNFVCNYTCKEFGYIIGIMSIMPNQFYYGGVERQFLKYDKTDFLIPEFVNCGETAIYKSQLYYTGKIDINDTDEIFGYQGLYDEYRSAHDIVCGGMTDQSFEYWHLARMFDSQPELNADFISGKWLSDTAGKRIFSVQESDLNSVTAQRAIIAHVRNNCVVSRALPYYPL